MELFIDIGNSRIKYTKNEHSFIVNVVVHDGVDALFAEISHLKSRLSNVQLLVTAGRSIGAQKALATVLQYAEDNGIACHVVGVDTHMIDINYIDTEQFGVDRFLQLLAAKKRYRENFCVVSCGTAITMDFYTNRHIGGMILGVWVCQNECWLKKRA